MSHSPGPSSSSTAAVASFPTSARSPTLSTGPGQSPSSVLSAGLRQSRGGLTLTTVPTLTRNLSAAHADTQPTNPPSQMTGSVAARPLYSLATPSSLPGLSESTTASPSTPTRTSALNTVSVSPLLTNKRAAFLNKHMRSKSSHFPGMMTQSSVQSSTSPSPLSTIAQNSTSRANAPPLFRSSSLPTVPQYERLNDKKFVPTLGSPSSPSSPWKNSSSSIQPTQERITNFKMRERSPSRRTSSSSLFSTSPKASSSSLLHHNQPIQAMSWANMDAYPISSSPSLTSCSSCPSTPNSLRSRSPSISSLETIPDSPDAEDEALEAERLAEEARKKQQQATGMSRSASSPGNASDKGLRRRSHVGADGLGVGLGSLNTSLGGLRLSGVSVGNTSGSPGGSSAEDKRRKRWSVCGGEKRADLELETIWEDRVVAAQSPPQQCVGIIGGGSSEYEYASGNGFGEGEMI